MPERVTISVLEPGMLTTVQDRGRFGQARYGVAPGGALDRRALLLGNRLLGNQPGDACLEISLVGPKLAISGATVIAITGASLGPKLNGVMVPGWQPIAIRPGDELTFDPANAGMGARSYLCVAGGIDTEPVLGSRSTDLIGRFGGHEGRALRRGDVLPVGQVAVDLDGLARRRLSEIPDEPATSFTARVVSGPQLDRFTKAGIDSFFGSAFGVSGKSNRQGIRLTGETIEHLRGADLVSEGIAHGAIQVPGDGLPIVLLAGRQTVGGYVKIATVIGADLDALCQLRPGGHIRFQEVSLAEAQLATAAYHSQLAAIDIVTSSEVHPGAALPRVPVPIEESELLHMGGVWDPAGVVRVIEAWERSSAAEFKLEVAEFGLKLELHRDGSRRTATSQYPDAPTDAGVADQNSESLVTAPVLGIFFRRSAPDQPELAEVGQSVAAGQVICVLEVMKTYHEVISPVSGTLTSFAVEDGDFVEYGQVIARVKRVTSA